MFDVLAPRACLQGDKKSVYKFIVQSFLAACAEPAVGHQTTVEVDVAGESFTTKGLIVQRRNFLDVYPYANWGGNDALPNFQPGATFEPTELSLR